MDNGITDTEGRYSVTVFFPLCDIPGFNSGPVTYYGTHEEVVAERAWAIDEGLGVSGIRKVEDGD